MNEYLKLVDEYKIMLNFNGWIMWSMNNDEDFAVNYYDAYKNVRYWCVDLICSKNISYSDIDKINDENQNLVFKKCRSKINIKKFYNIRSHEFDLMYEDNLIVPILKK